MVQRRSRMRPPDAIALDDSRCAPVPSWAGPVVPRGRGASTSSGLTLAPSRTGQGRWAGWRPSWPGSQRRASRRPRGQSLVEFALVYPLFVLLLMAVIEFSLALNALLAINFASREAALIAAEAGNADDADCVVLATVDRSIAPPAADGRISEVRIYRATTTGGDTSPPMVNVYARGAGSIACALPDGSSVTLAYSLVGTAGYPAADRCNQLAGCGTRTLDHVGVRITYTYGWHTPLSALLDPAGTGSTMVKANAMRMEPIL